VTNQDIILLIIHELIEGKNIPLVTADTVIDKLQLDSLDILDLQMQIEKRLNYSISINKLIECQKVQDLIDSLEIKN
jgi:acyl carrier protein